MRDCPARERQRSGRSEEVGSKLQHEKRLCSPSSMNHSYHTRFGLGKAIEINMNVIHVLCDCFMITSSLEPRRIRPEIDDRSAWPLLPLPAQKRIARLGRDSESRSAVQWQ